MLWTVKISPGCETHCVATGAVQARHREDLKAETGKERRPIYIMSRTIRSW
jgi:hypothetical protein